MGIAISGFPLAREVARAGQLGVVSGTAIDTVFTRRLQNRGVDRSLQTVLDRFPNQSIVERVLRQYATTLRREGAPYKNLVMTTHRTSTSSTDLLVLASFVEVALAKEGHDGAVGMNLLTKVQVPTVPTLLGAILAKVDYVLMGAGIPTQIPGTLAQLVCGEPVETPLDVVGGSTDTTHVMRFDPSRYLSSSSLSKPKFLGIVSSHVLATALAKRSNGPVDGFVIERPNAGGHNAPPRGRFELDAHGNPTYGARDRVDFSVLRELALPFWIGGGVTSAEHVSEAFELGAAGVQVGTLFAYCRESGMEPALRTKVLADLRQRDIPVRTSLRASSTGYPFKVVEVPGSLSELEVYRTRERKCDLGYLREAFAKSNGTIGYRCAAEPVAAYIRKGGSAEDTIDSTCLCNGLMATCGLAQVRSDGSAEPPIVTSGDCLNQIRELLGDRDSYGVADVIAHLEISVQNETTTHYAPAGEN